MISGLNALASSIFGFVRVLLMRRERTAGFIAAEGGASCSERPQRAIVPVDLRGRDGPMAFLSRGSSDDGQRCRCGRRWPINDGPR